MQFCKNKYGIGAIALYSALLAGCSTGYDVAIECYSQSQFQRNSLPSFTTYVMNVKSAEDSRMDVYLQMPFKHLRFEKTVTGYEASFSVIFIIRNTNKEIIQTKELERTVSVKTYDETTAYRFDGLMQSFVMKPSKYTLEIVSTDHLSQLRYKQTTQIEARKFSNDVVTASSLLLLDTIITDRKGISLRPIFPTSLSQLNESFGIYQELYNVRVNDTITISEMYLKSKKHETSDGSFVYLTPPYQMGVEGCNVEFDSIYYKIDSTFVIKTNDMQQTIQFYPLPGWGYNKIERNIVISRNSRIDSIRLSSNYFLSDRKLQSSISQNEFIAAMRYILREDEYDSLVIIEDEVKNRLINQFWNLRGGFDRRNEFEQRIVDANRLFTECVNGAETPMGIVFIICGIPDFIECRDGNMETWFYNFGERSYPVQFRRAKENIPYYTLLPFSVNDSFWQYHIDRWRRKR